MKKLRLRKVGPHREEEPGENPHPALPPTQLVEPKAQLQLESLLPPTRSTNVNRAPTRTGCARCARRWHEGAAQEDGNEGAAGPLVSQPAGQRRDTDTNVRLEACGSCRNGDGFGGGSGGHETVPHAAPTTHLWDP